MALPLPPAFRKKMIPPGSKSARPGEGENPLDEPSESDAPEMKSGKPNPLKAWANNKAKFGGKR